MKITPIFLVLLLVSCKKNIDTPPPDNSRSSSLVAANNEQKLESCKFGIQSFNRTKRLASADTYNQRKKPKDNNPPAVAPNATILLDFDGELLSGTIWNQNKGEIDAGPANLLTMEVDKVVRRVTEDFSPFNVMITTDEQVYNMTNPAKRMRVIVTESWDWFGVVGGTSYNNSFTWGNNTPCFVFSTLLNYNEKYIAEAISHELGHTLGLLHQALYDGCNFISEYNLGFGNGITSWAPIMGIGYYNNITTWYKGPTVESCNTIQDDVAIIANILGTKPDDNSGDMNKSQQFTDLASGLINSSSDIDYYYIDVKKRATLNAEPSCLGDGEGANMILKLVIYDKKGVMLRSANSPATLSASITLDKDKYYVGVQTAASEDRFRYGMLGSYTLRLND